MQSQMLTAQEYLERAEDLFLEVERVVNQAWFNGDENYEPIKLEKFQSIIPDLDKAIMLNPDFLEAYFRRGYIQEKSDKALEALEDYDAVLRLNPDDRRVHYRMATIYEACEEYGIAIYFYVRALEITNENRICIDLLDKLLTKLGNAGTLNEIKKISPVQCQIPLLNLCLCEPVENDKNLLAKHMNGEPDLVLRASHLKEVSDYLEYLQKLSAENEMKITMVLNAALSDAESLFANIPIDVTRIVAQLFKQSSFMVPASMFYRNNRIEENKMEDKKVDNHLSLGA